LVPVFGFGQNDVFSRQPKIRCLQSYQTGCSKWKKWAKVFIKACLLVPFARFGIMPDPRPITVVGEFFENKSLCKYFCYQGIFITTSGKSSSNVPAN